MYYSSCSQETLVIHTLMMLHKLNFEELFKSSLISVSSDLDIVLQNPKELEFFKTLPHDTMTEILSNYRQDPKERKRAFKIWFEANEEQLGDKEKIEILKFQLDNIFDN